MLVVREALPAKNGHRYWLCDCDCGKTSNVTTGNLKSGHITSSHTNSADKAFQAAGFVAGTQVTKLKEMKMLSTNTSGCRGVYWHKKQQKWVVRLRFQGKLMTFEDLKASNILSNSNIASTGEPKNPECEGVQDFYFLPFHSSLFTCSRFGRDFWKVISNR